MRKKALWKKTASVLVAAAMIMTSVPVYAGTSDVPVEDEIIVEEATEDSKDESVGVLLENNVEEEQDNIVVQEENSVEEQAKANGIEFSGGDGTEKNPYIITSPEQLRLINSNEPRYYKLGADLNLSKLNPTWTLDDGTGCYGGQLTGTLDGDGHIILGADRSEALIFKLYNGTVKNLTWDVNNTATLVYQAGGNSNELTDINGIGYVNYAQGNSNESPYIIYNFGAKLVMKNITNNINITAVGATLYNGLFFGYTPYPNSDMNRAYIFDNCVNNAPIYGNQIALFFGNATGMAKALTDNTLTISITNCSNKGKITGVQEAHYLVANMGTNNTLVSLENRIKDESTNTFDEGNIETLSTLQGYSFSVDESGNTQVSVTKTDERVKKLQLQAVTYITLKAGGTNRYFVTQDLPSVNQNVTYINALKKLQLTDDTTLGTISATGTQGHIPTIVATNNGTEYYYFKETNVEHVGGTKNINMFMLCAYDQSGKLIGVIKPTSVSSAIQTQSIKINAVAGNLVSTIGSASQLSEYTILNDTDEIVEGKQTCFVQQDNQILAVDVIGEHAVAAVGDTYYSSLEAAIEAANAATEDCEIVLLDDVVIKTNSHSTNSSVLDIKNTSGKTITINGLDPKTENVHTVTADQEHFGNTNNEKCKVHIFGLGSNVTLKNIYINGNGVSKHCINAYQGTNIVLENVRATGGTSSVTINASGVKITGNNTNLANGSWGYAIDVDPKESNAALTVEKASNAEIGKIVCTNGTNETSEVSIDSGNFEFVGLHPQNKGTPSISITGGTFSEEPSKDYLAPKHYAHKGNVSGKWVVSTTDGHNYNYKNNGYNYYCICGDSVYIPPYTPPQPTTPPATTDTVTNPDGSTTSTTTQENTDGSTTTTVVDKDSNGNVTGTTETTEKTTGNTTTKTETATTVDGAQTVTETTTVKNQDGSTEETKKVTDKDANGNVTGTTETVEKTEGNTTTTKETTTAADGSQTVTESTLVKNEDGSSEEKATITAADGSVTNVTTTTQTDGSATEVKETSEKNDAGNTVDVTATTKTDSNGDVTSVKEQSVITNVADNTSATVNVLKDGEDNVKYSRATVNKTVDEDTTRVKLEGPVVDQIESASGTSNVTVTLNVKTEDGDTKYSLKVATKNLEAGNKLYVYKENPETGERTMVNSLLYTVTEDGSVTFNTKQNANFVLVNKTTAAALNKAIKKTLTVAKPSSSVKAGKKIKMALNPNLNMENVKSVKYSTTQSSVAKVSSNGTITAKKAGTVSIKATITLKNGYIKTVTTKITVKE